MTQAKQWICVFVSRGPGNPFGRAYRHFGFEHRGNNENNHSLAHVSNLAGFKVGLLKTNPRR